MRSSFFLRWCSIILVGAAVGCGSGEPLAPSHEPPAKITGVSDLIRTATVGEPIVDGAVVKVVDAAGRPVQGASVAFTVTVGSGTVNPRVAVSDDKGLATTQWTLGTVVGTNTLAASVSGVSGSVQFQAIGKAGAVSTISLSSRSVRMLDGVDSTRITARAVDLFGNVTSPGPTFTVRDPTLLSIDGGGSIHALRRGAFTYVVATVGAKSDSVLVWVLAQGQSICTGAALPVELGVGEVLTDLPADGICVHASSPNAEYALVPFFNTTVTTSTTQIDVRGQGIAALSLSSTLSADRNVPRVFQQPRLVPDDAAELRRRRQERVESAKRVAGARVWEGARRNLIGARAAAQQAIPAVGDLVKYNADAKSFCDQPDIRTGRVMAVTDKAIVVADTNNPAGGFTQDEYKSFGVTFDTLIDPLDRHMFGDPSDIDNNGHVIMFFTRAVNELTVRNSGSLYLGFFYQRDLFPKLDSLGAACAGSNVAEMFYLLVPDPEGSVSAELSKDRVTTITLGTIAHEYQHLINASRRMYINKYGAGDFEELWLDEGLAHSAEELNFYKSTGLSPRSNLDATAATSPSYGAFMFNNQTRYGSYLAGTELQAPIGSGLFDTDLPTRGAIWNFLRYTVDRLALSDEQPFWFKLVNSRETGLTNIADAIGTPVGPWLRDWAISVFADDNAPGAPPNFQQPSWNMRNIISGGGLAYPLVTRLLTNDVSTRVNLAANGVSFLRFSVPSGQDALLSVTTSGQPPLAAVQLSLVRVR